MLKKLFKKRNVLNNQKGSALTITLIVIAVLSFSVVSVTKLTVNLSGQTNVQINSINDESTAKALITQMINEFEIYVGNNSGYDGYSTSIPSVIFTDVTSEFPEFGDNNGTTTKVFKFSYLLSNGDNLYKYAYVSTTGSSADTYHPFEFSLGTEGDLILNGGYYDEMKIFGKDIYLSKEAPWTEDDVIYEWAGIYPTNHVTPNVSGTYPEFSGGNPDTEIFFTNSYTYCNMNCWSATEDGSSPFVIDKSNYVNVEGSSLSDQGDIQTDKITTFFTDFSFEDFVVNQAANISPTDNRTITDNLTLANFKSVILDNADPYQGNKAPNTPYIDVTNYNKYTPWSSSETIGSSYVYNGDLTINRTHTVSDYDSEALIVLGDLTFNNERSDDLRIRGTYIVTGDLNITGYDVDINRATFIVFGETYINLDFGYSLRTDGNNYELAIIGGDNIIIDGTDEDYYTNDPTLISSLLYSEESIVIDAVESKLRFEGAIFARALGNSANPIYYRDELGNQINGIVINSYKGYTEAYATGNWWWGYWKVVDYTPSGSDNDNRFYMYDVPASQFQNNFMNIPAYENVTISDGDYTIFTSEWKKD